MKKKYILPMIILIIFFVLGLLLTKGFKDHQNKEWLKKRHDYIQQVIEEGYKWFFLKEKDSQSKNQEKLSYDVTLVYSFSKPLKEFLRELMPAYCDDECAVVIINNANGELLSSLYYDREKNEFSFQKTFQSLYPAASLAKVVTALKEIEEKKITPDSLFQYHGRSTTLYRQQIYPKKHHEKWMTKTTLNQSFAKSNNVIFGQFGVRSQNPENWYQYATWLGLGSVHSHFPIDDPVFFEIKDTYSQAELFSGYNRLNLISPVHSAIMSYIITMGNQARKIHFIKGFKLNRKSKHLELFYSPKLTPELLTQDQDNLFISVDSVSTFDLKQKNLFSDFESSESLMKSLDSLKSLMQGVVIEGTARKAYYNFPIHLKRQLILGGKTGSLKGGVKNGKHDWFTLFAHHKDDEKRGISISVLNINYGSKRFHSTLISRKIVEFYFTHVDPI